MSPVRGRLAARREDVRDRFGLLLLLLVGSFVALGASAAWVRTLAAVLQLAALVVAFVASGVRHEHRWLALLFGIGVAAAVLTSIDDDLAGGAGQLASLTVLSAILLAVLSRVLRHREVTRQTLYGAVCAYFLIGLMFSAAYGAMDYIADAPLFGTSVDESVYSYFSFTTLTTVGYGDYTAHTNMGRRVANIESVIGQVFIATTLARLVSLYKSAPPQTPAEETRST